VSMDEYSDTLLGDSRQELEDLLPAAFTLVLKGHDPLMEPDDGVAFRTSGGSDDVGLGLGAETRILGPFGGAGSPDGTRRGRRWRRGRPRFPTRLIARDAGGRWPGWNRSRRLDRRRGGGVAGSRRT